MSTDIISPEVLRTWAVLILQAAGASPQAATSTAQALIHANRRGLDSHGIVFLSFYLPRLRAGTTKGDTHPSVVVDLPALTLVDGRDGLGAYVASFAMELCCKKAKSAGAAVVAVRNSSHFGAASCYSELAAAQGCIGIAMSNSDPGMAPLGALGPVLGTNPLAIAAPPAAQVPTPSLDIASSTVAQGRIILASRAGTDIPPDWAIGPDGNPTQDPDEALKGAVLPMGGHKGFALAFMLDVLTGCLPGALLSSEIHGNPDAPTPQGTGHCFIAIHVASIRALPEYEESLRKLVDAVHFARRADWADQFMIPGEREARAALDRSTGIPMIKSTVQLLCSLGEEYGVPYPG